MDSALRYAYLFDIGWFLLFTCIPMLLIAALVLLRSRAWFKAGTAGGSRARTIPRQSPD